MCEKWGIVESGAEIHDKRVEIIPTQPLESRHPRGRVIDSRVLDLSSYRRCVPAAGNVAQVGTQATPRTVELMAVDTALPKEYLPAVTGAGARRQQSQSDQTAAQNHDHQGEYTQLSA